MQIRLVACVAVLILVGCGSNPKSGTNSVDVQAFVLQDESQCNVLVYRNRTSFHAANPERPYLYLNDQRLGAFSIGQSVCLKLPPGSHKVSVKEPILFIPTFTSGEVQVEVVESMSPVYIRYAKSFGGIVPGGSAPTVVAKGKMQIANEAMWKERQ